MGGPKVIIVTIESFLLTSKFASLRFRGVPDVPMRQMALVPLPMAICLMLPRFVYASPPTGFHKNFQGP